MSAAPAPRRRIAAAAFALVAVSAVAACSSSAGRSSDAAAAVPGAAPAAAPALGGNVASASALIAAEQPASASVVTANSVAAKIKARGTLIIGGVETGPLFSQLDPATGKVFGFDADLDQLLAKYITGKDSTRLVIVTAATREALLENHSVDAVFATYTITPAREKEVGFAGPYFLDGLGIAVKKGAAGISSPGSLAGKTVVTQSGSTVPTAIKAVAPTAKVLLFDTDAECVQALEQGRADAYVNDQGLLAGDALTNPGIEVLSSTFSPEYYGIGVPLDQPSFKAFVNTWLQKIEADGTWAKVWKATIGTAVTGSAPAPPRVG
jgi:glutamate transport system substrate-binding protein